MGFDVSKARELSLRVWKLKEGEVLTRLLRVGERLGLYAAMAGAGPLTAAELATRTGCDERVLLEWLYANAAAGLIGHEEGVFVMDDEAAAVLVNEDSLLHAGGAFSPPVAESHFDQILDMFRTGRGFGYDAMGESVAEDIDRSGGPWLRTFLPAVVIPAIDGLAERLGSGARVLEIGCGGAVALEALAKVFPASRFVGIDPSPSATALAATRIGGRDNVEIHTRSAESLGIDDGPFDLVMALDCLHDMPRPDIALQRVASVLVDDGVLLVKEIKSGGSFEANEGNPVRAMMYGFSVTTCLPSALSADGALGLGTLGMDPATLERLTAQAGLGDVRMIPTDDPVHHYFEVRRG